MSEKRRWTEIEDEILVKNQTRKLREIVQVLNAAGFERSESAVSQRYQKLGIRRRAVPKSVERQRRPLTPAEEARFGVLGCVLRSTRDRIASGELRTAGGASPAAEAVDIILSGINANPGILDELVAMRLGHSPARVCEAARPNGDQPKP